MDISKYRMTEWQRFKAAIRGAYSDGACRYYDCISILPSTVGHPYHLRLMWFVEFYIARVAYRLGRLVGKLRGVDSSR